MPARRNPAIVTKRNFARQIVEAERHLSKVCPKLGRWIAKHGRCELKIVWDRDLYESLVRAIAHQQLHGRAAETILGRLEAGFGNQFPSPRELARAKVETLRAMGFSGAKTVAIQGVAAAAESGAIPSRAEAEKLTDAELIERLVALKGVGQWTVEMLLIFTLGRLDIMPVDDYGVRTGLLHLLKLKELPKRADFARHTDHWRPYRSIGAWYLWRKAEAMK
jgi:DNA-3-methyladenine glycosylase II